MTKMERTYRTKEETIELFKLYQYEFERIATHAESDEEKLIAYGKAEAYEIAAFELEQNMK